jgi:hypothetical protein
MSLREAELSTTILRDSEHSTTSGATSRLMSRATCRAPGRAAEAK